MSKLIGRLREREILNEALGNTNSELIVVYGRRRVGKTFLIREFFNKNIVFEVTGLFGGNMKDQLRNFAKELLKRTNNKAPEVTSWFEMFAILEGYLDTKFEKSKKVIFIDEFPWIDTPRSRFLMAFENFWNNYCSQRDDLIIVICGSAASFMVKKVIKNKGGLHNRITRKIRLLPFNLNETNLFLKNRGIKYTHYDVLQLYMAIGGIPHYLEKLNKGFSVAQNIDRLCFSKDGVLNEEFKELYASLFEDSEKHMRIIRTLAESNKGITRNQLITNSGINSGGDFSLKLEELMESGFVSEYPYYQNKKQLSLYRLTDEYSKFYIKFIEKNKNGGEGVWSQLSLSQSYKTWSGFAFETICLKHVYNLKIALKIDAIYSSSHSWFNENTQIDLIIDRADNVINLCEIKFYNVPLTIDKKMYLNLKNKIAELQLGIQSRKNIYLTMITTFGVKENEYSRELVQNHVLMDSLFIL
jgi:AAA+ ATPase superfamily predicted ATPase